MNKAIILVAVPLAFELFLLTAVGWILMRTEQEERRSDHAKEVMTKASEMVQLLYDVGIDFVFYDRRTDGASERNLSDTLTRSEAAVKDLQKAVRDEPEHLQVAKRIETQLKDAESTIEGQKRVIASGAKLDVLLAMEMRRTLNGMVADLNQVISDERLSQAQDPHDEKRSKLTMKLVLVSGVVLSIMLAVLLVARFHQGTTRRLRVLMDNSVNLGAGRTLDTPMEGDDELAQLDRMFHLTANALQEAQAKERAVVDNAADVICSINNLGKFNSVSAAAEKLWGYQPDDLIGRNWREVVAEEDQERFVDWMNKLRLSDNATILETKVSRRDGSRAEMSWSAHWSGKEGALFCVAHDISERMEIERFKQQFIAMISHDLRTPLSAVKSTLEVLESGALGQLSEKAQTKISRAEDNLRHSIGLINDLIDLEKMDAGKMELDLKPLELAALVKRCISAVSSLAERKSIAINLTLMPVSVLADDRRLSQTIINLLGNAVKFSPESGTIQVVMEATRTEAKVSIIDQGPGIAPNEALKIFDRYYMSASGRSKQEGTGLGLTISKAIMEAHHGEIGVESQLGEGSSFWVSIPPYAKKTLLDRPIT